MEVVSSIRIMTPAFYADLGRLCVVQVSVALSGILPCSSISPGLAPVTLLVCWYSNQRSANLSFRCFYVRM
jgi:hypothetical protein